MGVKKSGLELVMKNAVAVLKAGGVVVFPTETSYGIGCDATNAEAVRRVFEIKGRPEGKGTPLIVDSFKTAERWGVFSPLAQTLAQKYWPGPLTIVVPATGDGRVAGRDSLLRIAPAVLQDNTVALRISSHPVARELAKRLGRPLIATSANRSGEPPAYSIRAFLSQIHHSAPDPIPLLTKEGLGEVFVVDVGALPRRKPTTLVKVEGGVLHVLRPGKIIPSLPLGQRENPNKKGRR